LNKRDTLLALFALGAWPLGATAQQSGKVYRVGTLSLSHGRADHDAVFEAALHERGWAIGRNIVFEYRFAAGRSDRLPALATELVQLGVDAIIAGLGTTSAASRATSRIPIIMRFGLDAVETGLAGNLGRPASNITGLSGDVTAEIMGKRLELLRETLPTARRLAVLMNPFPGVEVWRKELEDGARRLAFIVHIVEVRAPEELNAAFAAIRKGKPDALFCGGDAVTFPARATIAQFALEAKLPGVYGPREWAEAGGLLSYGVNLTELYRESAHYVDMILRGAKPAELPIKRPTKYDLLVNLRTAIALNLRIPTSVLLRADRVIE
jgi:putative ABC transport system substrate-binding protein